MSEGDTASVTVTFAGSGDAFGSGGRLQACIHLSADANTGVLLDCGATSLIALARQGIDANTIATVFVSHMHVDHFGGIPPAHTGRPVPATNRTADRGRPTGYLPRG